MTFEKQLMVRYWWGKKKGLKSIWVFVILTQIYLPTGTTIDVSLIDYTGVRTMNVFINPTVDDIENSGGLCDRLNSDQSKIFTLRSGQLTDNANLFVDSWE